MTPEKFQNIKKTHLSVMQDIMKQMGQILPQLNVFGYYKNDPTKQANIIFGVHPAFLENDKAKDGFINHVLPEIRKSIQERGFVMEAVAWSTEAWQRKIDGPNIPKNYRDLPATEVLLITLEADGLNEIITFEIKRVGKQVNGLGDLVDFIELENSGVSPNPIDNGRFSNLYKKLKQD